MTSAPWIVTLDFSFPAELDEAYVSELVNDLIAEAENLGCPYGRGFGDYRRDGEWE